MKLLVHTVDKVNFQPKVWELDVENVDSAKRLVEEAGYIVVDITGDDLKTKIGPRKYTPKKLPNVPLRQRFRAFIAKRRAFIRINGTIALCLALFIFYEFFWPVKAIVKGSVFVSVTGDKVEFLAGKKVYLIPDKCPKEKFEELKKQGIKMPINSPDESIEDGFVAAWKHERLQPYNNPGKGRFARLSNEYIEISIRVDNRETFCSSVAVQKDFTDHNGNFTFESVPRGKYWLYCDDYRTTTDGISTIEWLVPIEVYSSNEMKMDLNNDDSASIYNSPYLGD